MLPTPEYISTFIEQQFPAFYREEGPKFIEFVKAYYEWMESEGKQTNKTRNLFSTRDIDLTADAFVEEFKKKYLIGVPKEIAGDKRFLQKHIFDLYRSKGSLDGLKLLFRLLYNEEINVYIPSYDMLKPSHGNWIEKKYLEISYTDYNYNFNNKLITGGTSGATAFVESFERTFGNDRIINIFYISHIQGTFIIDEKVTYEGLEARNAPKILGSPVSLTITASVPDNAGGDILIPSSGNGSGIGLKTSVSNTINAGTSNATIIFKVINGGSGYTANPTITVSAGSNSTGTGATFTGVTLKDTTSFVYSTSLLNYAAYYPITETTIANTINSTTDFITTANTNSFANNDRILYTTSAGNTAITGLTNNTSYWVVSANSLGFKLSTTRAGANINITSSTGNGHNFYKDQVVRFNALTDVANTTDFISIPNNLFANGDHVTYLVEAGNTAISGLSNNTIYYVVNANTSGFKLATDYAGANINITAGTSEYGHTIAAINVSSYPLNSTSYGPSLNNASLSTILNLGITFVTTTIGTIDTLTGINPGLGYDGYISISVVDPLVSPYGTPDINGNGILGNNAVIYGNVVIGTGLVDTVRILNSGLGYYTKNENIQLYNSTQANTSKLSKATINLGGVGSQEGFWSDTRGFLDSNKYIQDSYYYQEYSYDIRSSKALDKYKKILKDLFHPAGNELFGRSLMTSTDSSQQGRILNNITVYRTLGAELATSATFNGNSGVSNTFDYITVNSNNELSDGDYVQYFQETANVESFNANTGVSNTTYVITTSNTNSLVDGDYVQYLTSTGNTVLSGLAYNGRYYVVNATSSSLQLANTANGSPINIVSGISETGHNLYQILPTVGGLANNSRYFVISANTTTLQLSSSRNGPAINISSTSRESIQYLRTVVPASGNSVFILNISRLL
jgi:hypothetical protein